MLGRIMLRVVGQQCCVRLHGPLVLDNEPERFVFRMIHRVLLQMSRYRLVNKLGPLFDSS